MKNKAKYTLMMTIPLIIMGGNSCKDTEYRAVIDGMGSFGANDHMVLLCDVDTDNTKIYYWDHKPNLFDSFELGDTVVLGFHNGLFNCNGADSFYDNHTIISSRDASMDVDGPTFARRNPDNPIMQQITRGRIRVY